VELFAPAILAYEAGSGANVSPIFSTEGRFFVQ